MSSEKNGFLTEIEIANPDEISFVEEGEHLISLHEVQTAKLDICKAVGILFSDGNKFLAHIDPSTSTEKMEKEILKILSGGASIEKIKIWEGKGPFSEIGLSETEQITSDFLSKLPQKKIVERETVNLSTKVGIDKKGAFYTVPQPPQKRWQFGISKSK